MNRPQQYITEPGQLEDIAIPAVLKRDLGARTLPPAPMPTGTEARVCFDIARRQAMGTQKYGTTVEDNPLPHRAWLQHAYEEALDFAIYLKRSIEQLDRDAGPR